MLQYVVPVISSQADKNHYKTKTTQPDVHFSPTYYYYAATSNRDMTADEHRHRKHYYVILVDD